MNVIQYITAKIFFCDLDVGACNFYVPIETFNISIDRTQNKQEYGPKNTCIEVRGEGGESYVQILLQLLVVLMFSEV